MNLRISQTLFYIIFGLSTVMAQPQLLADFNPGTADGMTDSLGYEGVYLDDNRMILAVIDPDFGTELGILENGELSLLKDINPGDESSDPQYFVRYNGKVYFSVADDGQVSASLWSTDGTEEGTVKEYSLSGNAEPISNLVVTDGGALLFKRASALYATSDGENFEELLTNVPFFDVDGGGVCNAQYTKYQNGFAFFDNPTGSPHEVRLWYYESGNLEVLHTFEESFIDVFSTAYGLGVIDGGLVFSIDGDNRGTYVYEEGSGEITQVLSFPCDRFLRADGVNMVGFREGIAFYRFSASPAEATVLFDEQPLLPFLLDGNPYPHIGANGKLVFLGQSTFFTEKALHMTDGTVSGTVKLGDLPLNGMNLQMLARDRYVFVVVYNNDNSPVSIYVADTEAATVTELYQFPESTGPEGSILLTGFQDGKLYFNLSTDETVGRELYFLETDLTVSVEQVDSSIAEDFSLEFSNHQFSIKTEGIKAAQVQVYDVQGRLLRSYDTQSGVWLQVPEVRQNSLLFFEVRVNGSSRTWKHVKIE